MAQGLTFWDSQSNIKPIEKCRIQPKHSTFYDLGNYITCEELQKLSLKDCIQDLLGFSRPGKKLFLFIENIKMRITFNFLPQAVFQGHPKEKKIKYVRVFNVNKG